VFHVLNRGNGGMRVFHDRADYEAFVDLLRRAKERSGVRVYAFCLMPNHFHAVVEPLQESALSELMQWWLTSHVRQHHRRHRGSGHVWQGRFKAFLVEGDEHFLTVVRYVLTNPARARLARRTREWRWSSARPPEWLDAWPVAAPRGWQRWLDTAVTAAELAKARTSVVRQAPFGSEKWRADVARKHGLESTLRRRGRPAKGEK
jgi:putative transposase